MGQLPDEMQTIQIPHDARLIIGAGDENAIRLRRRQIGNRVVVTRQSGLQVQAFMPTFAQFPDIDQGVGPGGDDVLRCRTDYIGDLSVLHQFVDHQALQREGE